MAAKATSDSVKHAGPHGDNHAEEPSTMDIGDIKREAESHPEALTQQKPYSALLLFSCAVFAASQMLFGYDDKMISPVAALVPFVSALPIVSTSMTLISVQVKRYQGPGCGVRPADGFLETVIWPSDGSTSRR